MAVDVHLVITAEQLDAMVEVKLRSMLASLGGAMLAQHGPDAEHPNDVLATMGGYLLQQSSDAHVADAVSEAAASERAAQAPADG